MTRPATRGEETCIFSVTIGREEDLAVVWQRACEIASSLELPGTEIGTTAFEAAAKLIADGHRGTVEFWLGEGSSSQVFFVRLNDTVKPSVQTVYSAMLPPEDGILTPEDLQETTDRILSKPPNDAFKLLRRLNGELASCFRDVDQRNHRTELSQRALFRRLRFAGVSARPVAGVQRLGPDGGYDVRKCIDAAVRGMRDCMCPDFC